MSNWLNVNPVDFAKTTKKQVGGVEVDAVISPYDVPDAVRSYFDVSTNSHALEFTYGGKSEPMISVTKSGHITLEEGKNSGRLYRILVHPKVSPGKHVPDYLASVFAVLSEAQKDTGTWRRFDNFGVAKDILVRHQDDLLDEGELMQG